MESLCNSDFLIRLTVKAPKSQCLLINKLGAYPWAEWGQQQTCFKLKGKQAEQDVTQIAEWKGTGRVSCPCLREFARHCLNTHCCPSTVQRPQNNGPRQWSCSQLHMLFAQCLLHWSSETNKDQPDVARIALTTDVAKMSNCHHYMASTFFIKISFP